MTAYIIAKQQWPDGVKVVIPVIEWETRSDNGKAMKRRRDAARKARKGFK